MTRYYLFRLKENIPKTINKIEIDYISPEVKNEDKLIVFIPVSLEVIGIFTKKDNILVAKKVFNNRPNLRDYYQKLSFIEHINKRTYKLFAKKTREIKKEDFELFI